MLLPEPNPKAPARKTPLVYKVLVLACLMSLFGGSLTGVMTWINLGFSETFFRSWLTSFGTAVLVMMPSGLAIMALLSRLIGKLWPAIDEKKKNLLLGVFMALCMESIMAGATAANHIGLADPTAFIAAWLKGWLAGLPLGLGIMLIMSMTLKPRIDRFLKS